MIHARPDDSVRVTSRFPQGHSIVYTDQRGPGRTRDITIPDLPLGSGIKVPTRDVR